MVGMAFIRKLTPCRWRYEKPLDDGVLHYGFIAQDLDKIASHKEHAFTRVDPDGTYRVQPWEMVAPIVRAIQEIDERLQIIEAMLMSPKIENADERQETV